MSKGQQTQGRIVHHALRLASRDGLEGLSIGGLATALGLSKSGLFAHFGSKESLQLEVLRAAANRFEDEVLRQAFRAPRGEPRLRAVFDCWLDWATSPDLPGGCVLISAAIELDDRPGPVRDYLVNAQRALYGSLARAASLAVEEGQFRKGLDVEQFAFEMHSIVLGFHHMHRLLRDRSAKMRARNAFEDLLSRSRKPARGASRT